MTQNSIQILNQISTINGQLAVLQNPQNQINRLNTILAALQTQLTPDIEPDADALAFLMTQAGKAVTAVAATASKTGTVLAPVALRQSAPVSQASINS